MQHPVALRSLKIALAFVGLLVGAGFATGAEVIQYFVGFGWIGIVGAGLAGLLVTAGGAVILQLGSVFLAADHKVVFRSVSHPVMARILDVVVTSATSPTPPARCCWTWARGRGPPRCSV